MQHAAEEIRELMSAVNGRRKQPMFASVIAPVAHRRRKGRRFAPAIAPFRGGGVNRTCWPPQGHEGAIGGAIAPPLHLELRQWVNDGSIRWQLTHSLPPHRRSGEQLAEGILAREGRILDLTVGIDQTLGEANR